MSGDTIIFVPGIRPKPAPDIYHTALMRCLRAGIQRGDATAADIFADDRTRFEAVCWSSLFYSEHADIAEDSAGIEGLLRQEGPTVADERDATSLKLRLSAALYAIADRFPVLAGVFGSRRMQTSVNEINRYFRNRGGVGSQMRQMVRDALLRAWDDGRRVMLIGHSFGAVLAWDALWTLSHRRADQRKVDMFVTLGTPLELNYIRSNLLGAREIRSRRYPSGIRRWVNINAIGEVADLELRLSDCYADMLAMGMVESIDDTRRIVNSFRGPDGLNVHKCYGYLSNAVTGRLIADWQRESAAGQSAQG